MVMIYTTETCPKCKMLKKKMELKNIDFTECNDIEVMDKLGFASVPWLRVDGEFMNFAQANNWIDNQEG